MRVYFYGGTEKAAKKKCNTFIKQLLKFDTEERTINVTRICVVSFIAPTNFPIPNGHSCQVFCEYSYVKNR